MKLQFPIRFKIVLLILAALTTSLLSYLYVGTQLIVEDKVSYIYDYTLAEVKSASEKVDTQLQRIVATGSMLANLVRDQVAPAPAAAPENAAAKALFEQHAKELGITGALVVSPADPDHFRPVLELGDAGAEGAGSYAQLLAHVGWTPRAFEKEAMLIGAPQRSLVPVGVRATSGDGKPLVVFTLAKLDQAITRDGGKNYEIRLLDSLGKTLLKKPASGGELAPEEFDAFAGTLAQGSFESGVRDWATNGREYIAGYQRLASKKLTVVSLISKDTAFAAAKQLITRSLFLGISILLLATGLTLIVVRRLTGRLREMWQATQKVGEGDFSVRVSTKRLPRDEVGGLARSFNAMADKISELMVQTAQKARMEKELETAQAVQSRFFPSGTFDHAVLQLAGQYMPASECAGDWWHYGQIGPQLVVVVGDVTGHGVSAALVTAAAHSTFMLLMKQFASQPERGVSLDALVSSLNSSVMAAAGGQSTMTFVASVINLNTGVMTMSNASHPPLYVYRKPATGETVTNPMSCFKPLMEARIPPLGEAADIQVKSVNFQLQAGDRVFWYTDGIMESRPRDGEKITKSSFLKLLASKSDAEDSPLAESICAGVMDEARQFFGSGHEDRPDDITLVVASIPADARFATAGGTRGTGIIRAA